MKYFRQLLVLWLVENNQPLHKIETPRFRELVSYLNPEGEAALWVSKTSVAAFVMRLYKHLQPQFVNALSLAISKIHISFDGWTTKGGKRGFFGVIARFADVNGVIHDLPIDLPQLAGAHTGEAIAQAVVQTLKAYNITHDKLGYFVLDNAANNNTAITTIARDYTFEPAHRSLRCACHTLNLIGQKILRGTDKDAYQNAQEHHDTDEDYMQQWRQHGPLRVLIDIINHIKTPQQYALFRQKQDEANAQLLSNERHQTLEPVEPLITRWNSYHLAFQRATKPQAAHNLYAEHHINATAINGTV